VQIKTLESKTDPHNCEISIHYPVYPLDGAKRLNDSIFQYIEVQKDNFLRDAKSYYSDLDSDDIEYGRFPFITIDVTSFYVTQSFASYCLEIAECPSYGCHGTNQYVTFNFDILRQQFLSPKDLFLTPDSGVCQVLCQYLDSAKIGCDIWRTTKFQKCNLSDLSVNVEEKNIVFNFSAYALGPGWYRVSVPRQKFALKVHD
jgi:hypothetical protein